MHDAETTHRLARLLDDARLQVREVEPLTRAAPLGLPEAYRVLHAGLALRLARGERLAGWKMGLTSQAKREQMNLGAPIYGALTSAMQVDDGGSFSLARSLHAKIEPEVAFVTARALRGKVTRAEALAACSEVCAALEILDSRFVGFKYFSLPDVVADNCSSSHFVLARGRAPASFDVGDLPLALSVDGAVAQQARTSAISGHPADSLVQLCAMLDEHGLELAAGSVVLAGAATLAEPLRPGMRVSLRITGLPGVSVSATA